MTKKIITLFFAVLVVSLNAQTVNILGTITTFDGNPIQGVTVTLVNKGQVATTDANGVFRFLPTGITSMGIGAAAENNIAVHGRNLTMTLRRPASSSVKLFNLSGALMYTVHDGILKEGAHAFQLPIKDLSQQMYLLDVRCGATTACYKMLLGNNTVTLSQHSTPRGKAETQRAATKPFDQTSGVVDTIRMSHPDYNAEFITFSSYVDTFNLVLAKRDWQFRFPLTALVQFENRSLHGFDEFDKWKPGDDGKNAWIDSVARNALKTIYRDSLEATALYRGSSLPDTFIYYVSATGAGTREGKSDLIKEKRSTTLPFPDDQWLYEDLTGTWFGFSGCDGIECGRSELLGCISHELFGHGMSNESGYSSNPKFYEGKNDGARYWEGGFVREAARKGGSWTDGYQQFGFFLVWLEEEKCPQLIYLLNKYCAKGKKWDWNTDWNIAVSEPFGLPGLQTLWNEYQATFN